MKIVLFIVLLVISFINSQECPFSQDNSEGTGTYYTDVDGGNCGYETLTGPLGPGLMAAALSPSLYKNATGCGQCFNITYNSKSVVVMGTDLCPATAQNPICINNDHFDFTLDAFQVLAEKSVGELHGLQYHRVPCSVNGNIKIMMKDGSSDYWTAFLVFNAKVGVKSLSTKLSGQSFVQRTLADYNYWVSPNMQPGAFQVKIESLGGEIITIDIPSIESRKIYDSGKQFSTEGCTGGTSGGSSEVSISSQISISFSLFILISIIYFVVY